MKRRWLWRAGHRTGIAGNGIPFARLDEIWLAQVNRIAQRVIVAPRRA
jgi:hypothetical protein